MWYRWNRQWPLRMCRVVSRMQALGSSRLSGRKRFRAQLRFVSARRKRVFVWLNRCKESICLDLKEAADAQVCQRLSRGLTCLFKISRRESSTDWDLALTGCEPTIRDLLPVQSRDMVTCRSGLLADVDAPARDGSALRLTPLFLIKLWRELLLVDDLLILVRNFFGSRHRLQLVGQPG